MTDRPRDLRLPAAGRSWMRIASVAALMGFPACGGAADLEQGRLEGVVTAGPTCPAEPVPPSPECRDRVLPGARMRILRGSEAVLTVEADGRGRFAATLPEARYRVEPQPVRGLLGVPDPVSVSVGADRVARVTLQYDTGIR